MKEEVLRIQHLCKTFYNNRVLKNINLNLFKGEVLGIVGGNGAGKSTLAKILSGMFPYDSGEIYLKEKKLSGLTLGRAQNLGLITLYQDINVVEKMTVAENIFLVRKSGQKKLFHTNMLEREAARLLEQYDLKIKPFQLVSELSGVERRKLELVKAVTFDACVIVLDEITSNMHKMDKLWVRKQVEALKKRGVSFIVISHDLDEVVEMCDRVAVMRDGNIIQVVTGENILLKSLLFHMWREEIEQMEEKTRVHPPEQKEALRVENLATEFCTGVNFELNYGEILGIYAFSPMLSDSVADALYGKKGRIMGDVFVEGNLVNLSAPFVALKNGVSLVVGGNANEEIFPHDSVEENISFAVLKRTSKHGIRSRALENIAAEESMEEVNLKPAEKHLEAYKLSGGQKQKLLIARGLAKNTKIYILNNVMSNVDFNSRIFLYKKICRLRDEGKAVLFFSKDYTELKALVDRMLVLKEDGLFIDDLA